MPDLEMFFNNQEEIDFLTSHLTKDSYALEYGSGRSTLAIAKRVRHLVSVEHKIDYYNSTRALLSSNGITNTTLLHVPAGEEPTGEDDGTYEQFKDYVAAPWQYVTENTQFDIALIDGRARVACAHFTALFLLKKGSPLFLHDYRHPQPEYRRYEYETVEQFLKPTDRVFALQKFFIK